MGCGNCGTSTGGKPAGCKSNGGCSSGGCNKMNVFDWLGTIPLPGGSQPFNIVEVTFNQGSRKEYFKNSNHIALEKGEWICVEGVAGYDMGQINLTGELVRLQLKKYGIHDQSGLKRILRKATEDDLNIYAETQSKVKEVLIRSRAIAKELKVDMKIGEVELQADGKKATFFYTAENRVDFRELIKVFATDFRTKIEMRQIGARQESAKVGGIGSCGRELCCSTWLTDFKSVNTTAARYQSLSINQTKLSGQCGRLKCCLNYELDTYMDALRNFPNHAENLQIAQGKASLIKKDIFRNVMWYSFSGSNKQYPMSIERVNEIIELNKKGIIPEELEIVEIEKTEAQKAKIEVGFVNDVGQISLKNLEKKKSKPKKKTTPKKVEGNAPTQENNKVAPQQIKAANAPSQKSGSNQVPKKQGNQHNKPQSNNDRKPAQNNSSKGNNLQSPPVKPKQNQPGQVATANKDNNPNQPKNRNHKPQRFQNSKSENNAKPTEKGTQ